MAVQGLATTDAVIVAFDDHLRRARGIGSSARQSYSRFAREFVEVVLGDGPVDLTRLGVPDVVGYVTEATAHYRPSTVQLLTTALRSFLRVVRSEGLREDRLEEAVPMVSRRRSASLPRHLGAADFARLIASLDSSSPQGLRDRAILLFAARLGLRASEVACLVLDDLDWRAATARGRRYLRNERAALARARGGRNLVLLCYHWPEPPHAAGNTAAGIGRAPGDTGGGR